jgi:hypothetical protein
MIDLYRAYHPTRQRSRLTVASFLPRPRGCFLAFIQKNFSHYRKKKILFLHANQGHLISFLKKKSKSLVVGVDVHFPFCLV